MKKNKFYIFLATVLLGLGALFSYWKKAPRQGSVTAAYFQLNNLIWYTLFAAGYSNLTTTEGLGPQAAFTAGSKKYFLFADKNTEEPLYVSP